MLELQFKSTRYMSRLICTQVNNEDHFDGHEFQISVLITTSTEKIEKLIEISFGHDKGYHNKLRAIIENSTEFHIILKFSTAEH